MTLSIDDLGVLGNLGTALGFLDDGGGPNSAWFGAPDESMKTMLSNDVQREALVAFVDDALGGADRSTQDGVVWLPLVSIDDPQITLYATLDDRPADHVAIGAAVSFSTSDPQSRTTLSVPLFRAAKANESVDPVLLGDVGGRIQLTTSITVDASAPTPGAAHLGAIGFDVDVPTSDDDTPPAFGLRLTGLQLPGAFAPRDLVINASDADDLDDALLDLILALVRAQAEALGGGPVAAVAGLLGLTGGSIPDFPVEQLASQGVGALAVWLHDVITAATSRHAWLDHLADLVGGSRSGDQVRLDLGIAALGIGLLVDTGPSGNARLTPTLSVLVGDDDARVEAAAQLCRIDLVTGAATALPGLGLWAAVGHAGNRVLDVTNPTVARADTSADRLRPRPGPQTHVRPGGRPGPTGHPRLPDARPHQPGRGDGRGGQRHRGRRGGAARQPRRRAHHRPCPARPRPAGRPPRRSHDDARRADVRPARRGRRILADPHDEPCRCSGRGAARDARRAGRRRVDVQHQRDRRIDRPVARAAGRTGRPGRLRRRTRWSRSR